MIYNFEFLQKNSLIYFFEYSKIKYLKNGHLKLRLIKYFDDFLFDV